jgi:hypothetical protein
VLPQLARGVNYRNVAVLAHGKELVGTQRAIT